jgi:hypothetical protein
MDVSTAESWMLPCLVKRFSGFDCPGCGIQRAIWDLISGDIEGAWHHYPPLFAILVSLSLLVWAFKSRQKNRYRLFWGFHAFTLTFIGFNYISKILT